MNRFSPSLRPTMFIFLDMAAPAYTCFSRCLPTRHSGLVALRFPDSYFAGTITSLRTSIPGQAKPFHHPACHEPRLILSSASLKPSFPEHFSRFLGRVPAQFFEASAVRSCCTSRASIWGTSRRPGLLEGTSRGTRDTCSVVSTLRRTRHQDNHRDTCPSWV